MKCHMLKSACVRPLGFYRDFLSCCNAKLKSVKRHLKCARIFVHPKNTLVHKGDIRVAEHLCSSDICILCVV